LVSSECLWLFSALNCSQFTIRAYILLHKLQIYVHYCTNFLLFKKKHYYECWLFFIILRLPNFLMDKHIDLIKEMRVKLDLSQKPVSLELLFFFKVKPWINCYFSQLISKLNGNVLNHAQVISLIIHLRQNYKTCTCAATLSTIIFRTMIESKPLVF